MDQGGTEEVPNVPARSTIGLPGCLDDRGRGRQGDIAKPLHDMGSGVFEIALPLQSDAFRVIYAAQLAEDIWVIHAFQKKSTQSIKTPKREMDLIKDRLKRLKEMLR